MVAVDNRGVADPVVSWLAEHASTALMPPDVEIVTVAELGWIPAGTSEVGYRNAYEEALERAVEAVRSALPGAAVSGTMVWGIPVEQMVYASGRADLLVLGSDKTGTVRGFISGTVPLRIVAHSACPVVVVPSGWEPGPRGIVVGVALEPSDDIVLDFAASEAERSRSALRIVHALPFPQALLASDLIAPVTQDEVRDFAEREIAIVIGEMSARYPQLAIATSIPDGGAAAALVDEGAGASMVVVGTHGRGLLRRLALGSVSHDLLLNRPCPVAVVRNGGSGR
jgi:nucleotide-binding universal stress UspA family protein